MKALTHYLRTELRAASLYALAAAALILSQHAMVFLAFYALGMPLALDDHFWLFPIRQLAMLPDMSPFVAIGGSAASPSASAYRARSHHSHCGGPIGSAAAAGWRSRR